MGWKQGALISRRYSLVIFFLLSCVFESMSQGVVECGTVATQENISNLRSINTGLKDFRARSYDQTIRLVINAHIVNESDGTGGLSTDILKLAIAELNDLYFGTPFLFDLQTINFINNSDYFDFNSTNDNDITSQHNFNNTINIYFFNSLAVNNEEICGYAYFPDTGKNFIMMSNGCVPGSTLAHEIGHYFALYHTHGKTNTGTTDELVNGMDCDITGDDVCDTPADPNLSGIVGSGCKMSEVIVDSNGEVFNPDTRNLMSYSNSTCRTLFTEGQIERMYAAYLSFKQNLKISEVYADFISSELSTCQGEEVEFTSTSSGLMDVNWTFSGGSIESSSNLTEVVSFDRPGVFEIKLQGRDALGNIYLKEGKIFVRSTDNDVVDVINEDFESTVSSYSVVNEDDDVTFLPTPLASKNGEQSLYINNYNYNKIGAIDYLIFPKMNAAVTKSITIEFNYAYANIFNIFSEGLEIVYETSCNTWEPIWQSFGEDLVTADIGFYNYVPFERDWKEQIVEFNLPEELQTVRLALRSTNGFGNNLFIDDFRVSPNDPDFRISSIVTEDVICLGDANGSVKVEVAGEGEFLFSLDNIEFGTSETFENLKTGSYTVYVKNVNSNITESQDFEIKSSAAYPKKPVIFEQDDELAANVSLLNGESIQWYFNDQVLEGENGLKIEREEFGIYSVAVTNGTCTSFSEPYLVTSTNDITSGLTETVRIYPNPSEGMIYFNESNNTNLGKVRIFNNKGILVIETFSIPSGIDISTLPNGIYIILIEGVDPIRVVKK